MKALKVIGIVVLAMILLVVILSLIAPKKYFVERSIVINAPKDIVFSQVQYWRYWNSWSPWAQRDSLMVSTVEGMDGQVGSFYKWVGDPKLSGKGEMQNTGLEQDKEITYHLHFIDPFESHSDGYVRVEDAENSGTLVKWAFYGKYPMPLNIMLLFVKMDKMMGPDFSKGLELLKGIAEQQWQKINRYSVQEVALNARNYAAVRKTVSYSEMQSFYQTSFAAVQAAAKSSDAAMTGAPAGLYFTWNESDMSSDMAAGFPVSRAVKAESVSMIEIPATKALVVDYYGNYEGIEAAHLAIDRYLKAKGFTQKSPIIEEYVTDPGQEPDPGKWLTRIYYPVE